jgi:hypothetical protein
MYSLKSNVDLDGNLRIEFRPSFFLQPIETHLDCLSPLPLQGKIYFFYFICIFSVAAIIWKEIV